MWRVRRGVRRNVGGRTLNRIVVHMVEVRPGPARAAGADAVVISDALCRAVPRPCRRPTHTRPSLRQVPCHPSGMGRFVCLDEAVARPRLLARGRMAVPTYPCTPPCHVTHPPGGKLNETWPASAPPVRPLAVRVVPGALHSLPSGTGPWKTMTNEHPISSGSPQPPVARPGSQTRMGLARPGPVVVGRRAEDAPPGPRRGYPAPRRRRA